MTWTKLSDDFSDDCWTLSDAAFRLHVEGLAWSNRKLLDCRIPRDDLRRFAKHPDVVQELLDEGWWSADDTHFTIRHHASYQRRREQVLKQQQANHANGKKGGRPRGKGTQTPREQWTTETDSVTEPPTQTESERDGTGRDRPGQEQPHQERTWEEPTPTEPGVPWNRAEGW